MITSHAYIIEGKSGSERDEFVRNLAASLECQSAVPAERPCGKCSACRQTAAGTNPDIIVMGRSGKDAYKTEDAALMMEQLAMRPYGRFKIGIIDDADTLSEIIQNKLLKTLEEPSEDTVILLAASNRDDLLSTVRSRCGLIRMPDSGEESPEDGNAADVADLMRRSEVFFYEIREEIDKKIKSRAEAEEMLNALEDACRDRMVSGSEAVKMAEIIELAEKARMDIRRGMHYSKALRRLFLELR